MSLECRLAFLVSARETLPATILASGYDLVEYFSEYYVLVTDNLDYEDYFEGPKRKIENLAKEIYIQDYVYSLDYEREDLYALFGEFSSEKELFDRWWNIKLIECSDIPTRW